MTRVWCGALDTIAGNPSCGRMGVARRFSCVPVTAWLGETVDPRPGYERTRACRTGPAEAPAGIVATRLRSGVDADPAARSEERRVGSGRGTCRGTGAGW